MGAFFWSVFRDSSNAIFLVDDGRRIVGVNDPALALLVRGQAELVGRQIVDVIDPCEHAQFASQWQALLRAGEYAGMRKLVRSNESKVDIDFAARVGVVDGRRLVICVTLPRDDSWPSTAAYGFPKRPLTRREREVVTLIAMGRETRQIAKELHISSETVRTHVRNAMSKLGARTRAQLVAIAMSTDKTIHLAHLEENPA